MLNDNGTATVASGQFRVLVAGDVVIDWNLARVQEVAGLSMANWNAKDRASMRPDYGRAAMVARLLDELSKRQGPLRGAVVDRAFAKEAKRGPSSTDPRFSHAYSVWEPHRALTTDRGSKRSWRISEFFGVSEASKPRTHKHADSGFDYDVVVLDDGGLTFRNSSESWPASLKEHDRRATVKWFVAKVGHDISESAVIKTLAESAPEKSVAIIALEDVRRTKGKVHVDRDLSWERIASDLDVAFASGRLGDLARLRVVMIMLGTGGVYIWTNPQFVDGARPRVICDPLTIEWSWAAPRPGKMIGYATCVTASVVMTLAEASATSEPDWSHGAKRGLGAVRELHHEGYAAASATPKAGPQLSFPVTGIANYLIGAAGTEGRDIVRDAISITIPDDWHPDSTFINVVTGDHPANLLSLAKEIVVKGLDAVRIGVPIGTFDNFVTISRSETEGYRGLQSRLREYLGSPATRPFSFTIFGPPGSGKSFGAAAVARCSFPDSVVKEMTFNLTQMNGPSDLLGALHEVRDSALRGEVPFVLWDEFDSPLDATSYGWMRHFLAPMQDGTFVERQIRHPVGKAVFAFAGGIFWTRARLESACESLGEMGVELRIAKAPDFLSRAPANIDVRGPNRTPPVVEEEECDDPSGDSRHGPGVNDDLHHVLRRAILLRSILERTRPHLIKEFQDGTRIAQIDGDVLHGLLTVEAYRHGARSLEQVVAMSALRGEANFDLAALPLDSELANQIKGDPLRVMCMRHRPGSATDTGAARSRAHSGE